MKFTKEMVTMTKLFVKHKPLRVAYYVGIGVVYLFGLAALVNAIKWW